jgi:hypothetical protein
MYAVPPDADDPSWRRVVVGRPRELESRHARAEGQNDAHAAENSREEHEGDTRAAADNPPAPACEETQAGDDECDGERRQRVLQQVQHGASDF